MSAGREMSLPRLVEEVLAEGSIAICNAIMARYECRCWQRNASEQSMIEVMRLGSRTLRSRLLAVAIYRS